MANKKQLILFALACCLLPGNNRQLVCAGDLVANHALVSNTTYNATEAANNKTKLVDAIKTGEILTCDAGGTFWFDGPLPLPPAYRRNATAYEIGDRVRADVTRIYECITAGTTAATGGPTGTGDIQIDNTVRWDYIEEVGATPWTKEGLNIQGPNSQHSPQALEEYGYPQTDQLRFIVRMDANSDTWMNLDDDQAGVAWAQNTTYAAGAVVESNGNIYATSGGGQSASTGTGPFGTTPPADNTVQWQYISPKRILTNINLRNFILQIEPPKPWVASRVYRIGDMVKNGDFIYICDTHGPSAPSGGPSGSGQDIPDNGARWDHTTLPGCGSGIKIGVPRQPASWISARGVRIDGVYITGFGQGYANPIDATSNVLNVSSNYGLRCNFVYDLDASNCAIRGFATGWDLYHCDLPHVSYLHGTLSYRTLRHVSHPDNSARPGTYYKVTVESSPGVAIELDSGLLSEAKVENGYATSQSGEFALDEGPSWSINALSDTISMTGAGTFLQPGMPVRLDLSPAAWTPSTDYILGSLTSVTTSGVTRHYVAATTGTSASSGTGPSGTGTGIVDGNTALTWNYAPWAGTDRILIIKSVFANSATFWNHTTQSYNPTAIPTCSGANFKRLMGVAVAGRSSRFSMRNPSLELNTAKPNLPLAVLQPGRETLYVDATVNEKGNMDASNAYAVAANNAGVAFNFGTVQCSGRFLAPNHPLAIVSGSPASGVNHLRPVTPADQWGVGPEACHDDFDEGRVLFRLVDEQWTRLLSDGPGQWSVPISVPFSGVTELRYRILCKADAATSLGLSCGFWTGTTTSTKTHPLNAGWQIIEGSLFPEGGASALPLDRAQRNFLRLHNAAVYVARVMAYPVGQDARTITSLDVPSVEHLNDAIGLEKFTGVFQSNGSVRNGNAYVSVGATASAAPQEYIRTRSTDGNARAIVSNNDEVARLSFRADNGVDLSSTVASIRVLIDGGTAVGDTPGRISFYTTADGAAVDATERWRINNAGHFLAGVDNSTDIGAIVANRPRNLYVGTDVKAGGDVASFGDISAGPTGHISGFTITAASTLAGLTPIRADTDGHDLSGSLCAGHVHHNAGATGPQLFNLPAPAPGMKVTFVCVVAQDIDINPFDATDTIVGLTNAAGDAISSAAPIGNSITLVGVDANTWVAISSSGTWTDVN